MQRYGLRLLFVLLAAAIIFHFWAGIAETSPKGTKTASQQMAIARDGQHDFDFELGMWKTHISRLQHPLSGSTTWIEYEGTTVVRKVWNGRANLVELEANGPAGHFEGLSLRLYDPQSHQWSLNLPTATAGDESTYDRGV
jgi:hypothetical protein